MSLSRTKNNQHLVIDILTQIYARVFDVLSEIEHLIGVSFDEFSIKRTEQYSVLNGELISLTDHQIVGGNSGSDGRKRKNDINIDQ